MNLRLSIPFVFLLPALLHAQSQSVFRLRSKSNGIAFVMHTQGRTLYLLTAMPLLGDARQPGGPPCTLDHGPATPELPCTVLKTYDTLAVAIIKADASSLAGRFPALTLCGSDDLTPTSSLKSVSSTGEAPARYIAPEGFYSYLLSSPPLPLGTPILNANQDVVGLTVAAARKDQQPALALDMVLLALSSDDFFRGQLRRPTPPTGDHP